MNIKKKKGLWIAVIFCMMLAVMPIVKADEQIVIDGNFSDWEVLQLEYTELNDPMNSAAVYVEADAVYLHMIGRNDWTNLGGVSVSFTQADGTVKTMELQNGNNEFDLVFKDTATYQVIAGAASSGSIYQNARTWEMQIPTSWCNNPVSVTINDITFPVKQENAEIPDVDEPEDSNDQQGGNIESGIVIDGYFEDWENLGHTPLEWSNNVIANACAVMQDDQICVHVGTTYYSDDRHLNLDNIVISINDKTYHDHQIKLRLVDHKGNISNEPLQNIKQNHRYQMVAVINREGKDYVLGDAYYATKKAKDREDFEFCMKLSELKEALNIELDTKDQITISFPSIGDGSIIIEGTSSGPWIIVGFCGLIALVGIYLSKKKMNK